MKKIILGIVLLCTVTFAFAGNTLEDNLLTNNQVNLSEVVLSVEAIAQSELINFEVINQIYIETENSIEAYPCRWRYCITSGGVSIAQNGNMVNVCLWFNYSIKIK